VNVIVHAGVCLAVAVAVRVTVACYFGVFVSTFETTSLNCWQLEVLNCT
jgi:hypothetical protein